MVGDRAAGHGRDVMREGAFGEVSSKLVAVWPAQEAVQQTTDGAVASIRAASQLMCNVLNDEQLGIAITKRESTCCLRC